MSGNEFYISTEIIQLILSFLKTKDALRASLVSKSWYKAWATRPDLDFDQRNFGEDPHAADFLWLSVNKSMRRYCESNLPIRNFRLRISYEMFNCSVAEKVIDLALRRGATGIDFEVDVGIGTVGGGMALPRVVLESETLRRLSVRGCKIGLGADRKAKCSRLELLRFKSVVYTDGNIIWDIISSCPLIENLSLSDCKIVDAADATKWTTELWRFRPFKKLTKSAVDGVINPFSKMKSLFLERVPVDKSFFQDIGSKFPCLKDLSIHNCDGRYGFQLPKNSTETISFDDPHEIKIASSSLESISLVQYTRLKAMFDVPCIRKFTCHGTVLPTLTFVNHPGGGKLELSVSFNFNCHCPMWFHRLKEVLANLSQFEICLWLEISDYRDVDGRYYDQGLLPVAVKDLILYLDMPSPITYEFLKGVLWTCRPEFITFHLYPEEEFRSSRDLLVLLNTTRIHGLSAVNVEVFDEGPPAEWRQSSLETLLQGNLQAFTGTFRFQMIRELQKQCPFCL